jgi:hypothetical protein
MVGGLPSARKVRMIRVLEEFSAYERSRMWGIHHAYFERVGAQAWRPGALPHVGANSLPLVKQNARVLVALVEGLIEAGALGPQDEVRVLEVGSGLGRFATGLIKALAEECGDKGRELLGRLTYVFSDFSRKSVLDAVTKEPLSTLVRGGVLEPGLLDLTKPDTLRSLDGDGIASGFCAVYASYVCCQLPLTILRKTNGGFQQKFVQVGIRPREAWLGLDCSAPVTLSSQFTVLRLSMAASPVLPSKPPFGDGRSLGIAVRIF